MMIPPVDPPPGAGEVIPPDGPPDGPPDRALVAGVADGPCHEPSEAELAGLWPDPFAGPPEDGPEDDDRWLADLTAAELDAIYQTGEQAEDQAAATTASGFEAGGLLDGLEPGPALAGFSQEVLNARFAGLSDDELVGVLRASRRLSSWQAGVELAAVAELDARRVRAASRPGWSRVSEHVSEELAAALVLTGRSADSLLGLSRDLARLPMVLAALLAGRIDRARAVIFASELAGLGDIAAAAVAAAFIGSAGSMTTGQLRAALRAMVLYVDPKALRRRAEKARADTRVEAWQEGSGNAALAGRELLAADAIAADERISAIARALKDAGAAGTMDQLRAAVFTALLAGRDLESLLPEPADEDSRTDDAPAGPGAAAAGDPGSRPAGLAALAGSVHLTMPVSAWLSLSDAPGEVADLGPLDAWTCRDLAGRLTAGPATRWCVTLTGPGGRAVAHACARGSPWPSGRPCPPGRTGPHRPASLRRTWLAGLDFTWLERSPCAHSRQGGSYRPGNLLRELVKVRHRTCAFPGCRRPARRCDCDHTVPYDQGGRTCECNLAPVCRLHHRSKQAPGWQLTQTQPGILVWTLPHGRSYTVTPEPYLV